MQKISSKIFRQEAKFICGATKFSHFPKVTIPEFAFIGKSNVGKSSLINLLVGYKNLARTSNIPGRTQQINFFTLQDKLILVDLPGYGFAKVPITLKIQWQDLSLQYLLNRSNLRLVNILIDARHGIKENDENIIYQLHSQKINFQIIYTKVDKIKNRQELINSNNFLFEKLNQFYNIIFTSSRSKEGAKELQYNITNYIRS